jgi:hypothetical protein
MYLHELVDEVKVLIPFESWLLHTHVGRVLEQLLVVGAHIQADGQHAVRGDPSCA